MPHCTEWRPSWLGGSRLHSSALSVAVMFVIFARQQVEALPPCGISLLNRTNTSAPLVSAFSYLNDSSAESILEAANWNASVSSVISGCGGTLVNGTFVPTASSELATCRAAIARVGSHGVCWEARIYVYSPHMMEAAAANATSVAAEVARHVLDLGLSGVSFDWERKGENKKSHHSYLAVTSAIQAALRPIGARVTSFSNNFYHDIMSFKDLAWHNDKVLCGETYVGNPGRWREQFHRLLNSPAINKLSPVLQADTKHGHEDCEAGPIKARLSLISQNFTEVSIFSLNGPGAGHMPGRCFSHYIPFLQAFRNGTLNDTHYSSGHVEDFSANVNSLNRL